MPTFENTRTILGESGALDALLAHTLTTVADDELVRLNGYALSRQPQLETVYIPNATNATQTVFSDSKNIKRIFFATNKETKQTFLSEIPRRAIVYVPDNLVDNYKSRFSFPEFSGGAQIVGVSQADTGIMEWDEAEITDSWAQILAKCANGTAASSYCLGQFKTIDLGEYGTYEFQIVGINADELADGSGNAALTWFNRERALRFGHRMNPSLDGTTVGTGAIGGMEHCEGQTYLDETVFPMMPNELKTGIKMVKKYTSYTNGSGTRVENELTTHKLWFASIREMNLRIGKNETMGPIYVLEFPDSEARKRKSYLSSNSVRYWLRTGYDQGRFYSIDTLGNYYYALSPTTELEICFGFCT